jgi:hypothetical protein
MKVAHYRGFLGCSVLVTLPIAMFRPERLKP